LNTTSAWNVSDIPYTLTTTTWNGYALQEQEIGRQLEEALAFMQPSWAMFLDLMMVPNET
jgi:hypothetical protein